MTLEELKIRQLTNQYLLAPADKLTVVRDLCGVQAQFMSNAMHALKIRTNDYDEQTVADGLVKNWAVRGSVHVFAEDDLPLFVRCNNGQDYRKNDWNNCTSANRCDGWTLTPQRQKYFSDLILASVSEQPQTREELKELCRANGMTQAEEDCMFESWGGGIRELCERGFLNYAVQELKQYVLSPEYSLLPDEQAELEIARRYFTNFSPATIHDAMYYTGAKQAEVKNWLRNLPVESFDFGGRTYYYIPNGKTYDRNIPHCIFLAGFDQLMLGYQKKESLYLNPEYLRGVFNLGGIVMPALLLDGDVAGIWKNKNGKLEIKCFRSLSQAEKSHIEQAADKLWGDIKEVKYKGGYIMDKHLIGKWYKEEFGETLNIFGGNPPRMKMSFSSSGYYNFEPNCVYEDGADLCFEINDEHYRMVYHVHYEDGDDSLCGYYTQFGKKTDVKYVRISDVPENGEYRYAPTEIFVPESEKTRLEILREYADYQSGGEKIGESSYELCAKAPDILKKYDFDSYFEGISPDNDEIVFAVLAFVCDHFGHDGCSGLGKSRTIEGQIRFCEEHNGKANCRGLAILLAVLLRLKGIKARHITCMPYEEPFEDCHVVVDCELPSGERIMLDPTSRLYYTDKDGKPVSLRHLRRMLIDGEELFPNKDASYNGGSFDAEYNRNYMTKNTFRFFRGFTFSEGIDERSIDLIPLLYVKDQIKGRAFTTDEDEFWKM